MQANDPVDLFILPGKNFVPVFLFTYLEKLFWLLKLNCSKLQLISVVFFSRTCI